MICLISITRIAIGCLFAFVVAYALYTWFFGPMAPYPGPWLAKLTPLYNLYHAYNKQLHLQMYKLHQQYGESGDECGSIKTNRIIVQAPSSNWLHSA